MITTLAILVVTALCFAWGRVRADLVAICSALGLVLTGVLTPEEALTGFSNPLVVMMGGLFIVGGGIFGTGLAKRLGEGILGLAGGRETRIFVLLMLTTALVGAFVSNTGTVALMLPIVVSLARGAGLPPSRFLMPLAFAGSMGGMLTLIGTPPNLIVRDALAAAGYEAPGFFSFTPVGLLCVAVGTAVLLPLSRRFLGRRTQQAEAAQHRGPRSLAREYGIDADLVLRRIGAASPMVGMTLRSLALQADYGVNVIEVRRCSASHAPALHDVRQITNPDTPLRPGDVLYLRGEEVAVARLTHDYALQAANTAAQPSLDFFNLGLAEVLLPATSSLVGRTVAETEFRSTYGLSVLGVRRGDTCHTEGLAGLRLRPSDIVLVQGSWKRMAALGERDGNEWLVLGQPAAHAARVTLDYKAPLAALIMVLMVVVMAFDFIPVAPVTAVVLAAVAMIFTGCVRSVEAAYKAINWESLILFASMLPMAVALEKTGADDLLSEALVQAVGHYGPYALLAAVYVATSLLTFFISNTVTAVLMAPIALQAAAAQGVSAVPLLMAVTVAASMCFASPFSTPPNALVMSAGGYTPMQYLQVGLPLQLALGAVMLLALPLLFPF